MVFGVLVVLAPLVTAMSAAAGDLGRGPTKLFEIRFSVVGEYRWTADETTASGGCTTTHTGSGRADLRAKGRALYRYQRRNQWPAPRLPRHTATMSLSRSGSLIGTSVCPPDEGGTVVQTANAGGCGSVSKRVKIDPRPPHAWNSRKGRWEIFVDALGVSGPAYESTWRSFDPCPLSANPGQWMVDFPRWGPSNGFFAGYERLTLTEPVLMRKRFIRLVGSYTESGRIRRAPDPAIGDWSITTRYRVLLCAKSAGGCGARQP